MMNLATTFDILAIILGLASATLWFISAAVKVPTITSSIDDLDHVKDLTDALQKQSKWSKWAAIATGLAVASSVLAKIFVPSV
jgi:hypothetical protein